MSDFPSLEEARQIIRDTSLPWRQHVQAVHVITTQPEPSVNDFLACLKIRGVPAEWAACTLYLITHRPRSDSSVSSFVLDHDDWAKFLREHEYGT